MKGCEFVSTRGGTHSTGLRDAIIGGLAPDGGLYVPACIPDIDVSRCSSASYAKMAESVLQSWIGSALDGSTLSNLCRDAFNYEVPLVPLEGGMWNDCFVLELFHGPTMSFKDFGARTMARMMASFLEGSHERVMILVATSGDTGSAVADGFAGQSGIRVILLYPHGQVSPTQERQLTVRREGVVCCSVEGSFDDCQRLVKRAFADQALSGVLLSSANSINIGRLLPQMLYYFWAMIKLEEPVTYCVPSGNLGNLTAGILAHCSGLPVKGFIAAHNSNRFFADYLMSENARFRNSIRTLSNAMDVGAPSNFERIRTLLGREEIQRLITAAVVDDRETIESMRRIYDETGYVADPHTAVGLEAVRRARSMNAVDGPVVVLSTAHPAKFPETVEKALEFQPERPERLSRLWNQPTDFRTMEASSTALNNIILEHLD